MKLLKALQVRLGQLQVGLGLLDLGLDGFLGRGLHLLQPRPGRLETGLGLGHRGCGFPRVEGDQNLSGLHPVPLPDMDLLHPALDFGVNRDLGDRGDIPGAEDLFFDEALGDRPTSTSGTWLEAPLFGSSFFAEMTWAARKAPSPANPTMTRMIIVFFIIFSISAF